MMDSVRLRGSDLVRTLQRDIFPYPIAWARGIVAAWARSLSREGEIVLAAFRLTREDLAIILANGCPEWAQIKTLCDKARRFWRPPCVPDPTTIQALSSLCKISVKSGYRELTRYLTALLDEAMLEEQEMKGCPPAEAGGAKREQI